LEMAWRRQPWQVASFMFLRKKTARKSPGVWML
jgi:hypothetical protein